MTPLATTSYSAGCLVEAAAHGGERQDANLHLDSPSPSTVAAPHPRAAVPALRLKDNDHDY